jgi:hypothetical protein
MLRGMRTWYDDSRRCYPRIGRTNDNDDGCTNSLCTQNTISAEHHPLHKWIGTYNVYRIQLMRFFKWLYSPDIEQKQRPKPSIIENIPQLKRKEKSIYKPTDLWTPEDDSLFLKYCPNARDRCYHAMSRD